MVQIRNITEQNLAAVDALYNEAFKIEIKAHGSESGIASRNLRQLEVFKKMHQDVNVVMLGCYTEKNLVGFLVMYIHDYFLEFCLPFASVWGLCVKQSAQNQGIGTALMKEGELIAKEKYNCNEMWLFSGSKRTDAHKFYEKLGYNYEKEKGFVKRLSDN